MRMVCSECGSEIPEGADFCYKCGANLDFAMKIDENGAGIYSNRCFSCGGNIRPGEQFCACCGKPVNESYIPLKTVKPSRLGVVAILVAFFGGLVDVFGLGHLILKKWAKASAFLVISAVLFYLAPSFIHAENGPIVLIVIRLFVFIIQMSDIFNAVYRRSD